jgi:hypothetical protein
MPSPSAVKTIPSNLTTNFHWCDYNFNTKRMNGWQQGVEAKKSEKEDFNHGNSVG